MHVPRIYQIDHGSGGSYRYYCTALYHHEPHNRVLEQRIGFDSTPDYRETLQPLFELAKMTNQTTFNPFSFDYFPYMFYLR